MDAVTACKTICAISLFIALGMCGFIAVLQARLDRLEHALWEMLELHDIAGQMMKNLNDALRMELKDVEKIQKQIHGMEEHWKSQEQNNAAMLNTVTDLKANIGQVCRRLDDDGR